jgi:hypothetical protein
VRPVKWIQPVRASPRRPAADRSRRELARLRRQPAPAQASPTARRGGVHHGPTMRAGRSRRACLEVPSRCPSRAGPTRPSRHEATSSRRTPARSHRAGHCCACAVPPLWRGAEVLCAMPHGVGVGFRFAKVIAPARTRTVAWLLGLPTARGVAISVTIPAGTLVKPPAIP